MKNTNNCVDLSNLPRRGKLIDWKNAFHIPVSFSYRGTNGIFYVEKDIDADHTLVSYNGKEYELPKISIVRAALGKIFNFSSADNYKYEIGSIVDHPTKASIRILKQTRSKSVAQKNGIKAYEVECLECHNVFEVREGNLNKGDRCPYCSNHKVKVGFNDIAHTNPELMPYFANQDDAYKYVLNSNKPVDTICPVCGTPTGERTIYDLSQHRIRCPVCGKGSSYPNRFMFNLLRKLNIDSRTEVTFDWCVFPDDKNVLRNINGRYDFVLDNSKTIIEMDSGLGHGKNVHSKANTTQESDLYKDRQKELLAAQHGYSVIRVNCEYYGHEDKYAAVKQGILKSRIPLIIDLSNVDWDEIDWMSQSNLLKDICDCYLDGYSVSEIAELYGLTIPTIRVYLHKGEDCGLCTYGYKKTNRR